MSTQAKPNNGQFAKGTSGNPSGRPTGSRNQSTLLLESMLEGEAPELLRKAIELGKAGNLPALQLCLNRVMPAPKDQPVCFDMPPMRNLDDISQGVKSLFAAISEGKITPQQGELLFRILEGHANIMNMRDVERRVEKLERGPSKDENKITIVKSYR